MKSYSQYNQDLILLKVILKRKKKGVFVDIGANDGVIFSNSYIFEKFLNWKGICFEPQKEICVKLKVNRSCEVRDIAISDKSGVQVFNQVIGPEMLSGLADAQSEYEIDKIKKYGGEIVKYEVKVDSLTNQIEASIFRNSFIDFASIDVEGGELNVLKGINKDLFNRFGCFVVENNNGLEITRDLFRENNFLLLFSHSCDDYFVNSNFYNTFDREWIKTKKRFNYKLFDQISFYSNVGFILKTRMHYVYTTIVKLSPFNHRKKLDL